MSKAWFCIPSARPAAEVQPVIDAWRDMGYGVALWREQERDRVVPDYLFLGSEYPGYARAINTLAQIVLEEHPECNWLVIGGDDTFPDPNRTADEIALECEEHFNSGAYDYDPASGVVPFRYVLAGVVPIERVRPNKGTFGVMQPTGDRYAQGSIDRIAGSAWMGREWCLRANGGQGPLWPEFEHMFVDECLQGTAKALGVFWQRPDLVQLHRHFMRESDAIDSPAVRKPAPPHLERWNTREHWDKSKAIFERLRADGFRACFPK